MKQFINSLLAGLVIGLSGTIFLCTQNKIVGSILFTIGLFTILNFKYSLFTGMISKVVDEFKIKTILNLIIVLIGNFCGVFIFSLISKQIIPISIINNIVEKKINTPYINLFILGFICNILIYLGVRNFNKSKSDISKYVGLFLTVPGFILCGAEHSIADMFYFSLYGFNIDIILSLFMILLGNICGGIIIPLLEKIKSIVD